ncbi:MAG: hypothetical protein Q7J05_09045 [Paludibacter sp.]|nr:hypothetical protein [Paludibacter sp.]
MSKYVTFLITAILIFGMTLSVQAQVRQERQRPERKETKQPEKKVVTPEKRAEFMAKQLELTPVEQAKLKAYFEKQDAKTKQRHEAMKKMREEQLAKMKTERDANQAELIKIIGNEKFQQMQSQRIARLEKENKMMKMRMMHKDGQFIQQPRLEMKERMKERMKAKQVE